MSSPLPARSDVGSLPEWDYIRAEKGCAILYFKSGARVFFAPAADNNYRGDRKRIMDQSTASRLRAAWTFKDAECRWLAMSTLTWRFDPEAGFFHPTKAEVLRAADYLRRKFKTRWGEPVCAWMMEIHRSGVPHFHLFHAQESAFGQAILNGTIEPMMRRGVERRIVRGGADYWLRETWMKAIRRTDDPATRAFNCGGLIELFDSPQGACRYVAKEAAKRYQKELPAEYPEGLGQWWWLNPRWAPRVRAVQRSGLESWPYEHPASYIFDAEEIGLVLEGDANLVDIGKANLKTWESWARM